MHLFAYFINLAVDIYIGILVVQVAISWLIAFEVMSTENQQARNLIALLKKATDPIYKPLRKYVPPIGGIDITPIIAIMGLSFLRNIIIGALY